MAGAIGVCDYGANAHAARIGNRAAVTVNDPGLGCCWSKIGHSARYLKCRKPRLLAPAAPMPANEKPHPVKVNFLGAEAIVHVPDTLAHLIQQAGGLQWRGAGFHGKFTTACS
jgi:hypothetical protein